MSAFLSECLWFGYSKQHTAEWKEHIPAPLKPRADSNNGDHEAQQQSLSFTTAVQRHQKAPAEAGALDSEADR